MAAQLADVGNPAHPQTSGRSAPGRSGQPGGRAAMHEPTTSAPASLPRADSTRLTGVQAAERLNVPASTWRSYVAPGQAPAADGRLHARTPWWVPARPPPRTRARP